MDLKINHSEVEAILKGREAQKAILSRAQSIAAACGPGYEASAVVGRHRIHGSVITGTYGARRDNSRRQTILKSLGAGRRG